MARTAAKRRCLPEGMMFPFDFGFIPSASAGVDVKRSLVYSRHAKEERRAWPREVTTLPMLVGGAHNPGRALQAVQCSELCGAATESKCPVTRVGNHSVGAINDQASAVFIERSGALRPHCADQVQPTFQLLAKLARSRIVSAAELANEPVLAE